MKRTITVIALALTLAGISGIACAQDRPDSADMQRVTVTASPGQYETYEMDLDAGFGLQARVGNTHRQFLQASRATAELETLRTHGKAATPFVTVAIDNSARAGSAWQYVLTDRGNRTLAIVNVYCKRAASAGSQCRMVSLPVAGALEQAGLANLPKGSVPLAQIQAMPAH